MCCEIVHHAHACMCMHTLKKYIANNVKLNNINGVSSHKIQQTEIYFTAISDIHILDSTGYKHYSSYNVSTESFCPYIRTTKVKYTSQSRGG